MEKFQGLLAVTARLLLTLIFISSAVNKIIGWEGTATYMANHGLPMVKVLLAGAVVFEIAGGLSVLLGFKARIGALALIVFLVAATILFHNFWAFEGQERQDQLIHFMKNLSIMGGLLLIFAAGSGPLSLDNAFRKNAEPARAG